MRVKFQRQKSVDYYSNQSTYHIAATVSKIVMSGTRVVYDEITR